MIDVAVLEVEAVLETEDEEVDDKEIEIRKIRRRACKDTLNLDVWVMRDRADAWNERATDCGFPRASRAHDSVKTPFIRGESGR